MKFNTLRNIMLAGIVLFVALVAICSINGCGNMDFVDWHWTFDTAIIKCPDGNCTTVKVKSWHDFDNSDMVQIETENNVYCTHSANIILIKTK